MSMSPSPTITWNVDSGCRARRLGASLGAFLRGPWFAYGMLAVLQLRVIWGIWHCRDLTRGDTSWYFVYASQWFEAARVNILWSPLYTIFYGSLMFLTRDPYRVTMLHRLVIVLAASLLVLAVFRRLLPPALAWFAAAWWVLLPTNFNVLYEVHLFALLPSLVAWLVLLSSQRRWARGVALGIMAASVVLVRNEMAVATMLFAAACAAWEWHARRLPDGRATVCWRDLALAYGAPLAVAVAAGAFLWSRSTMPVPELRDCMRLKHTLNMSQVFTFSYEQRHPEYIRDPWTDYQELMDRKFGGSLLPLSTMLMRNPRAVWAHFWWNWQLVPIGVEVLLFNSTSGNLMLAPDYPLVIAHATWPRVMLVLLVCCWIVGLERLVRNWRYWWETWLRPRMWGWVGMLAVVAVVIPVITTQRPRPSYLFSLSVFLMAVTAMSLWVMLHRWDGARWLARWAPLAMAALVAVASPYQEPGTASEPRPGVIWQAHRPLHDLTRALLPYEAGLPCPGTAALLADYLQEATAYVWRGRCPVIDSGLLERDWPAGEPLNKRLDENHVGLLYLNERVLRRLEISRSMEAQSFLNEPGPFGWQCVNGGNEPGDRWRLYVRAAPNE